MSATSSPTWSVRIDALSAVMLVVVNTVSFLVHVYSWGYMSEDPHKARFFSYLSFFTFSMFALVTANDFLQLFFGWEGVGVASYLLIGFWYHKRSANDAAIKAFITNRVGDFGFALGIMAVFFCYGTIQFDAVFEAGGEPGLHDRRWRRLIQRHRSDLLPSVHRRDGQVGAVLPARLVAGRDGRPDAGLRAHPRRHHGHRGRVHGLPRG